MKRRFDIRRIAMYAVLVFGALVFAYPFVWMALATLKPEIELSHLSVIPQTWSIESYEVVFKNIPIERSFLNSLIVAAAVTASALVFGSMAGYSLAKLKWRGRDSVFNLILFTMMVPFAITFTTISPVGSNAVSASPDSGRSTSISSSAL